MFDKSEVAVEGLRVRINELYGRFTEVTQTSYQGQPATKVGITMDYIANKESLFLVLKDGQILDHTQGSTFHMVHVIRGLYEDITPRQFK